MGQYRPSGLIPSTLTSDYTIDATVANNFRCRINGTSPTTKYQLKIMKNDAVSTSVYDSGVVALSSPLFPVNYDGTPNELIVSVPSNSGMTNGEEYKWTMTSYWSDSDKYESYENVFKAYANASVSITNFVSTVTARSYTFIASVMQAQGVGVERFGWIIRNKDSGEEVVNTVDENNIYSSDIRVTYDGFLSGTTEEVMVKCWLNDGTSVETEFMPFTVQYDFVAFENLVTATVSTDSGVLVKWNKLSYINGTPTNSNYNYVTDGYWGYPNKYLHISSGNKIVYDTVNNAKMSFPGTTSHIFSFYNSGTNSSIYRADGVDENGFAYYINVGSDGTNYYLDINGNKQNILAQGYYSGWITMIISPALVRIINYTAYDLLYPRNDLYPGNMLYPVFNTKTIYSEFDAFDINTNVIWNSISVSGDLNIRYVWIEDRELSSEEVDLYKDVTVVPTWDNETLMLALYNGNLSAGNISSEEPLTGWIVYRNDVGSAFLRRITSVESYVNSFVDYSVRNMTGVIYYVSPIFGEKIGAVASSNVVSPQWWDWSLIVCSESGNDVYQYQKTYSFDLDVSSGSMNNNTTFNELQNFTKYAKIQNSTANYWSGTLSAFIGNCSDVAYSDSVELMDELKALTTDGRDKFLKDRKGNLWKVRLNSPISEKITDEYVEQAVVVTIGWAEIGDASRSVIIGEA